jgi:transposase-like protein
MGKKTVPYCSSKNIKKKGFYKNKRQRYQCRSCGRQFQNRPHLKRLEHVIWKEYIYERQMRLSFLTAGLE